MLSFLSHWISSLRQTLETEMNTSRMWNGIRHRIFFYVVGQIFSITFCRCLSVNNENNINIRYFSMLFLYSKSVTNYGVCWFCTINFSLIYLTHYEVNNTPSKNSTQGELPFRNPEQTKFCMLMSIMSIPRPLKCVVHNKFLDIHRK